LEMQKKEGFFMYEIKLKRAYDNVEREDGYRVLVDRLWPRGIKKEDLHYDAWEKDIAPSSKIRKEFGHEKEKYNDFRKNYLHELAESDQADDFVEKVKEELQKNNVTLLYGAKDRENNQAVVLKEWLGRHKLEE